MEIAINFINIVTWDKFDARWGFSERISRAMTTHLTVHYYSFLTSIKCLPLALLTAENSGPPQRM